MPIATIPSRRLSAAALAAVGALALFAAAPASLRAEVAQENEADLKPIPSMAVPLAADTLINAVAQVGDRLVGAGAWGHVLVSADQGNTWTQVKTPVNVTLTSIRFVDDKTGFITGHDATILKTTDGGSTWKLVQYDPQAETPLFDVFMKDANSGFAVGAYSLVKVTADGGETWTTRTIGDLDMHMNALARAKDGKVWIAGEAGHVFVTDAEMSAVQDIETPYSGSFWNVLALDDGSVLVMGLRGNVWRTADNGATWSQSPTGTTASLQAGRQLRDGSVMLVGLEGAVLVSKDRGVTFTQVKRAERTALATLFERGDGKVLLFGEGGVEGALTN
ncbi:WD40/YVTN/BNR-like repeat-containing protein [Zavarzinia compransoris]|uniref:Photosynthesis system II assembly factor Ycf48/Hcf136-like domain-containing protein n=1 Tax=Zavarzinia compransoris TaxID=1264899 RepID=A0A317E305_9PROT|nr:YCF48-related protein [Zavarzinia compransoris]PWR20526.1 hypothetical protein DKG75_10990 [Zavarzinia compransoris]TDP43829.1 photosystem II stability/assembly factor-like uncharacterized protein [Zavarzinia compransoris]